MEASNVSTWIGIAVALGGAGLTFGLLKGLVDEQERRIVKLEERADYTDEALKAIIRLEEQIKYISEAIDRLLSRRPRNGG